MLPSINLQMLLTDEVDIRVGIRPAQINFVLARFLVPVLMPALVLGPLYTQTNDAIM